MAKKAYIGVKNFTPRGLPSGYTQIEYIESTGTQYINTGFAPNNNTRVVMDAQFTAISGAAFYFGARASGYVSSFGVLYSSSASKLRTAYGSENLNIASTNYTARVLIDKNKNSCKYGTETITHTTSTFQNTYNMYLFASNEFGTAGSLAKMKLYSCQIYDNGTLIRDYVPAKNSSGTAGLYDLANSTFYTNAGSGTFTAGSTSGSFARQVKKWYVGIDGVARKVKKAYIGVNGTARQFFGGGELRYHGTATELSYPRFALSATTVGDYAVFGSGYKNNNLSVMDAYSSSLVRSSYTNCGNPAANAATTVGDYAVFAGGGGSTLHAGSSEGSQLVTAYNTSLVRSLPTGLSVNLVDLAATTVGNYALFGGGCSWEYNWDYGYNDRVYKNIVHAYDTSLTRTLPTALSVAVYNLSATTVGNYALFAGGSQWTTPYNAVNAYSPSLTRTLPTALSVGRYLMAATTVGNYALFAGGRAITTTVDVYNSSLTRTTTTLNSNCSNAAATSVGDYALIGGGLSGSQSSSSPTSAVTAFDSSLTKSAPTALSAARTDLAATSIGEYALFGGGWTLSYSSFPNVVDVYTVA